MANAVGARTPPQPLTATRAFSHYIGGSGTPLQAPFSQLNTDPVLPSDFSAVRDSILLGPGEYAIDGRLAYTTRGANADIFGDVTLRLQGTLTVEQTGYKFRGNLKAFDDFYDFNPSTHRGFVGEFATAVGRATPGSPYWIEIRGSRRIYAGGAR